MAYDWVTSCLHDGLTILIHCRSGKDRTGLLMAYYLARHYSLDAQDAIARVKAVRPIAFSSEGWPDFVLAVLANR